MSQDNQNSQPSSPEPEAQPPQKPYQRVQPIWKATIIQILRRTIGVLETTVEKLETQPSPGTVEARGGASLNWWSGVLSKIRSFLPENLSIKLSDTAITGIIAAIAVILLWTTSTIFSAKPTEVAIAPTEETPPATITTPPEVEVPPTPPAEEITPPVAEETPPPVEETPPPVAETPPPETPPEPEPTPTPSVLLTPEQTLIAAIENQVAEISDRFASGLIQSIQANFRNSSLAVIISDEWYTLNPSQQEKLLSQMLQRSKELDFSHLDIIDSQGRLVARNPVVGTEMIIFQQPTTLQ